jgi:hypothetical protein
MDWGAVICYLIGVPVVALFVSSWWLFHFAEAQTAVDTAGKSGPDWSIARRILFAVSSFPLLLPGIFYLIMMAIPAKVRNSGRTLIILGIVNGILFGTVFVAIIRAVSAGIGSI